MNWLDGLKVAVIDFETTGLSGDAQAVELAIVHTTLGSGVTELVYCQKFLPTIEIEPGATKIHGLTVENLSSCPSFESEWAKIELLLENRVISAYNLPFDLRILRNHRPDWNKMDGICGLFLSRHLDPQRSGHSLIQSCEVHGIEIKRAHSASDDAVAAAELLGIQVNSLKKDIYFSEKFQYMSWQRGTAIQQERGMMIRMKKWGKTLRNTPWTMGF